MEETNVKLHAIVELNLITALLDHLAHLVNLVHPEMMEPQDNLVKLELMEFHLFLILE